MTSVVRDFTPLERPPMSRSMVQQVLRLTGGPNT
jgi:hypothetical protein